MIHLRNLRIAAGPTLAIAALLIACGGEEAAQPSKSPTPSPVKAVAPERSALETVTKMSADAQKCLELARADRYVEAVEVCRIALQDSANADVQRAYDEAQAAAREKVQAAAQQAAAEAAAQSLSGEDPVDAAKGALGGALDKAGGAFGKH